ncbi:MAG: hypothetical protein RR565_06560 [Erysipelothrix sp.]
MKYRVTKYNPQRRSKLGNYPLDEWTSISDIGEVFLDEIFTLKSYLIKENQYLSCINLAIDDLKVEVLEIRNLEKNFSFNEIEDKLKDLASDNYEEIFNDVNEGVILNKMQVSQVARLILRECIWCELVCNKFVLSFGYDYYMYFDEVVFSQNTIEKMNQIGLFVEKVN